MSRHVWLGLAACASYLLKRFNQRASADDLRWILGPTSELVAGWSGRTFSYEAGFGYVRDDQLFVIAPVCSGVNFLVVLFASLTLAAWVQRSLTLKTWLAAAVVSFATCVLTNSIRIALSLAFPEVLGLSAVDSHRIVGVGVFCLFLLVTHRLWNRSFGGQGFKHTLRIALGVYLAVALVVPWLRGSAGVGFDRHAMWTLALVLLIGSVVEAGQLVLRRWHEATPDTRNRNGFHVWRTRLRRRRARTIESRSASTGARCV